MNSSLSRYAIGTPVAAAASGAACGIATEFAT